VGVFYPHGTFALSRGFQVIITRRLRDEARVGDFGLRGVDLVEIDESTDRIASFTVTVRPLAGLMALGARMTGSSQAAGFHESCAVTGDSTS
jgi:hypothetical protein